MGLSGKKKKQQRKMQDRKSKDNDPPNQQILDSVGSPNVWTPKDEDAWIDELDKMTTAEIYQRFPPLRKPPNVGKRGKNHGWGDNGG